jgi:hypothetical protein
MEEMASAQWDLTPVGEPIRPWSGDRTRGQTGSGCSTEQLATAIPPVPMPVPAGQLLDAERSGSAPPRQT